MKEIVILSGKGGAGKTSLTAALAALAENAVLCDADVDAADLHLLLAPETRERHDFVGGGKAHIDVERCSRCGKCLEMCRFAAISQDLRVDDLACEGCGVCAWFCPEQAVELREHLCGEWFISHTRFGMMAHAALGVAEENSGRLVSLIRREAAALAKRQGQDLLITDGPPGVGCPVIACLAGAALVVMVVEPTVSGRHDMARLMALTRHFRVPTALVINKSDINAEMSAAIVVEAAQNSIQLLGHVAFSPLFTRAMLAAQTIIEYAPASEPARAIQEIWRKLVTIIASQSATLPMSPPR
ncbi:MAG: 4Fe-4S binding protein [Desulfobulbaceae bacterium]|jgi:MinD superfamily P-loop ATPase|nr:4Fe-4S binding protein [Desulfobulbaceae bacterium]